ncbi:hypothetical protein ACSBR1_006142 [Camellia fascicularis]
MPSNAVESFNNWISEARHLPITHLVDTIRGKIMEKRTKRRLKSSKWTSVICPKMEKKLESELQTGRSWIVSQADDNVYEIHSHPSVTVDIFRYKYKASYSGAIFPIPTAGKLTFKPNDYLIAPPIVKRPPGRPKQKRIPSKGEVIQRIQCGHCGKMGNHNRKTCKEPMQSPTIQTFIVTMLSHFNFKFSTFEFRTCSYFIVQDVDFILLV